MKRSCKKSIMIRLMVMLLSVWISTTAFAAPKDVTSKFRKPASKFLKQFDDYLGYGNFTDAFVFDNYARTTMSIMGLRVGYMDVSQARKKARAFWKNNFTGKVNFKLRSYGKAYARRNHDPSFLYLLQKGKPVWTSGNWGPWGPKGYVKSIIQKNRKTFIVTYNIHEFDLDIKKDLGLRVGYQITLKRSGNTFKIKDIKRTRVYTTWTYGGHGGRG